MKLILRTHCTNEFFDGCAYALVDLTPTLARKVLRRRAMFEDDRRNDPDLTETSYYSGDADYFSALPTTLDEIERRLADTGFTQAPTDFRVDDELLERTECGQMVISTGGMWFQCYRSTAIRWSKLTRSTSRLSRKPKMRERRGSRVSRSTIKWLRFEIQPAGLP